MIISQISKLFSYFLKKINKNIDNNIFKALDNVNLNCVLSYIQNGEKHSFLDDYDNKKNKQ